MIEPGLCNVAFADAGDSLAGRYFTFHLLPLTPREAGGSVTPVPDAPASARSFIEKRLACPACDTEVLDALLNFGAFPEPFLLHSRSFYRKWAADYLDTVIREDIAAYPFRRSSREENVILLREDLADP